MGMIDHLLNGRSDPAVITWRTKHIAASNIFSDWRSHNFYSTLAGSKPKAFKDFVTSHKDVKDLGELPESEEDIYQMMSKLTR